MVQVSTITHSVLWLNPSMSGFVEFVRIRSVRDLNTFFLTLIPENMVSNLQRVNIAQYTEQ